MYTIGNWIIGFSKFIGIRSILHVELWAILLGLNLETSVNATNLEIETDSLEAIKLINNKHLVSHPLFLSSLTTCTIFLFFLTPSSIMS